MFAEHRRRRAARRVKPGDGRPLKPYRWWQPLSRVLFHLPPDAAAGRPATYSVEVRTAEGWRHDDGEARAHLYRDGRRHATSKLPAAFAVEGGTVEVAMSSFGLRRCHFVGDDGAELLLTPDLRSAEGRRARLEREHPTLSRAIGLVAVVLLVVGVGVNLVQAAEPVSQVPLVAAHLGTFTSPVRLPWEANVALAVGAALASTERALRLRYHWLLDAAGG